MFLFKLFFVYPKFPQLSVGARYFQWVSSSQVGERRGCFLSQPELIIGADSNSSGGREMPPSCVKMLPNRIQTKFSADYGSKVRSLLKASEIVVPIFQPSGLAGLQGNGNSRWLGTIGRRGQPISTVNSLKTARNLSFSMTCRSKIF